MDDGRSQGRVPAVKSRMSALCVMAQPTQIDRRPSRHGFVKGRQGRIPRFRNLRASYTRAASYVKAGGAPMKDDGSRARPCLRSVYHT